MRKRTITAAVACGTLLSSLAIGQFAVIDASSIAQAVKQLKQLVAEYQLLQDTYRTTTNTYNQIATNARNLTGKGGWRYATAPLIYPSAPNAYGTSAGWMKSLNTGLGAAQNYEMATSRMASPAGLVGRLSPAGRNQFAEQSATIELGDSAAEHAMSITGATRANAASQAAVLSNLESATLSDDPAQNTEAAILNKVNAAAMIGVRSQQDTNRLLAAIADQQTIAAKVRHDSMVSEINASAAAQAEIETNKQLLLKGNQAAHSARLP